MLPSVKRPLEVGGGVVVAVALHHAARPAACLTFDSLLDCSLCGARATDVQCNCSASAV